MSEPIDNISAFLDYKNACGVYEGCKDKILQETVEFVDNQLVCESSVMQEYLNGELTGDTVAKKLATAALTIAADKGLVKLPDNYSSPEAIASIADKTVETVKLANDVATGKLTADEAVDYTLKKSAAMLKTVTDRLVDTGVKVAATTVTAAIISVCPPAAVLSPVIQTGLIFVGEQVKKKIGKGINKLAEAAKPIVKKVVETAANLVSTVKQKSKKIINWLFG